ncbi:DUF2690 domain-containing protein [Kitasatospora sp. NPDC093806]|uniref:helix-turn-helix domain-containing protein n=1 Tax=Kitasatospora sp. NPDC093806 TaxID=3155075 RepID=UPI00344A8725
MGSAWKQLPDDLSAPAGRLTEELRAVKDATGLSLSELAARTHYSRASWERWLNGKRVITEQALDALIGAVECDGPALRALWAESVAGEPAAEAVAAVAAVAPVETVEPAEPVEPEVAPSGAEERETGTGPEVTAAPVVVAEAAVPEPAAPATGRVLGRPVALITAAVVAVLLLVLAVVRYTSFAEGEEVTPTTAGGQPTASADTGTPTNPVAPVSPPSPAVSSATNPAPPVPACQAIGCSHKDPKATGCGGDARTLQTTNIGKVVVYLRYSQKCQAAWAAITEGQPGDQATVTTSSGETETALIHWGYDNYSWMVNAADPAVTFQVCGRQSQPEGASCTNSVANLARLVASTPIPIGPASPPPATTPAS